jgi:16S rRNA (guanine527-N7)-methyltransferase
MQTDKDKIEAYLPHLSNDARAKLGKYYDILLTFNAKINLVSKATAPFSAKQHFADAVMGLELCFAHTKMSGQVFDFGSGNGFPGLVLGVLRPDLQVNLVESDLRKAEFMKHVAGELKATNISVLSKRYETLPRESVVTGVTRALGSLPTLLIQMNTLFADGGLLFHFKSDSWTTELANCPTQVFSHWDIQPIGHYTLPESTIDRYVVVSKKI